MDWRLLLLLLGSAAAFPRLQDRPPLPPPPPPSPHKSAKLPKKKPRRSTTKPPKTHSSPPRPPPDDFDALFADPLSPTLQIARTPGALATLSSQYVCATLDWWPAAKCDYGRCAWGGASLLDVDLDDPLLRAAARSLAPFLLRLGGSLSDAVEYTPTPCASFARDDGRRLGFGDGCLGLARWDALHAFCADVGCRTIFRSTRCAAARAPCPATDCRNARPAPPCCTEYSGRWDGSGAAALLRRAAGAAAAIAARARQRARGAKAIEAHLDAAEYAR